MGVERSRGREPTCRIVLHRGEHSIASLTQLEQNLLCSLIVIDGHREIDIPGEARLTPSRRPQASDHGERSADGVEIPCELSQ